MNRYLLAAILAAVALVGGIVGGLAYSAATQGHPASVTQVTQLKSEVSTLKGQLSTDENRINAADGQILGLTAEVSSLNSLGLSKYNYVCNTYPINFNGQNVTGYYPCTSKNPNG